MCIGLDNGLASTRQQAIIWTNDGEIIDAYMCHSASMSYACFLKSTQMVEIYHWDLVMHILTKVINQWWIGWPVHTYMSRMPQWVNVDHSKLIKWYKLHLDGLVQETHNSIASAMELHLSPVTHRSDQGILSMGSANERQHYIVTLSLIGWAHTQNDPCWYSHYLRCQHLQYKPWIITICILLCLVCVVTGRFIVFFRVSLYIDGLVQERRNTSTLGVMSFLH